MVKILSETKFLIRKFKDYYEKNLKNIPEVSSFSEREFAFIPWGDKFMKRHMGFSSIDFFKKLLTKNGPRHVYYSGALYKHPEVQHMEQKGYEQCDFLIDIDVDHFYTPCKVDHDYWFCKECFHNGSGIVNECKKCGSSKLKKLSWICKDCLNIAKNEIKKLIDNFLIPDFGINYEEMLIAFSGHRGYHLKIESEHLRNLNGDERREIVDYLTGENLDFEVLGLNKRRETVFGLSKESIGWSQKLIEEFERLLINRDELSKFLRTLDFKTSRPDFLINSFLNTTEILYEVINNKNYNEWSVEGFDINKWKIFLNGLASRVGAEIDEPVSIDTHRLIRYPSSLHGKTGFKVQELSIEELDDYNPLDESNPLLDPIVFQQEDVAIQLEITEENVPKTILKGTEFGPYVKGDISSFPSYMAIFLLCKQVAKPMSRY
jgi:DNA primase small subunit